MRKCNLLVAIFIVLSGSTFAGTIKIKRSGSKDGSRFKNITEVHSDNGNHSLSCIGAGATVCGWTISPSSESISQNIPLNGITNKVKLLILSGSTTGSWHEEEYSVSFEGSINSFGQADFELIISYP